MARFDDARVLIGKHGASLIKESPSAECAVFCAVAGRVLEVAGSAEIAAEWYARAFEYTTEGADSELDAEVQYFFAASAFSRRDFDRFEMHVAAVLRAKQPWLRAQGHAICGLVATLRGDYEKSLASYEAALLLFSSEREAKDRFTEATCLRNYVIAINTLNHLPLALAALAAYDAFPWTQELSKQRFDVAIGLADLFALWGDDIRTYRLLRDAEACAPDRPSLLHIHAARCQQAFRGGERMFAFNELTEGTHVVDEVDWSTATVDHRFGLLEFAIAASAMDISLAHNALTIYKANDAAKSALLVGTSDPRLTSVEKFSFGVVAAAEGRIQDAVALLHEALEASRQVGYQLQTARIEGALRPLLMEPAPANGSKAIFSRSDQREIIECFLPAKNKRVG